MEALRQPWPRTAKILAFDGDMGTAARKKAKPPNHSVPKAAHVSTAANPTPRGQSGAASASPQVQQAQIQPAVRGREVERWSFVTAAVLSALFAGGALLYSVHHDRAALAVASSDEHIEYLISRKLEPLTAQLNQLSGQINQMNLDRNLSRLKKSEQGRPAKAGDQSEALAGIRSNLAVAQKIGQQLPLAEVRQQVQHSPKSGSDYWTTVAAIINYQSYLNQVQHGFPDPKKVAKDCMYATSLPNIRNNVLSGTQHFNDCYVDLDTNGNLIADAVIRNSVVRYHGGNPSFQHAEFVNCVFEISIDTPLQPTRPDLMLALLDSDQINFRLPPPG